VAPQAERRDASQRECNARPDIERGRDVFELIDLGRASGALITSPESVGQCKASRLKL
jgi:hypothetical protein